MSAMPSASSSSAGRILLVEDDAEISRMLRQVLSENGFTACWVTSAAEMEPVL
jgi:DNA-binding response OmpR family regulator